jgi:hypothetical protein
VPAPRINDIVRERRGVSADTAMVELAGGIRPASCRDRKREAHRARDRPSDKVNGYGSVAFFDVLAFMGGAGQRGTASE